MSHIPFHRFETLQLHAGQETADPATDARAVPIYQTTSYVFHNAAHAAARFHLEEPGNIYGRLTNATQGVLEARIAALEGGTAALAVASGAAAIAYTIQALAQAGEHIVAQRTLYGGTYNLLSHTLPQYGIATTFVNVHDLDQVEQAIQENTKAIYLETLGNPNSDIPDLDAVAALAHRHGLPLVIDNTFGTPYLIRPIEHGADVVVHSATKFIGGHGTSLGGVIVESGRFDWKASGRYAPIAAPNPSYHGVSFAEAADILPPSIFHPKDLPPRGRGTAPWAVEGVLVAEEGVPTIFVDFLFSVRKQLNLVSVFCPTMERRIWAAIGYAPRRRGSTGRRANESEHTREELFYDRYSVDYRLFHHDRRDDRRHFEI